MDQGIPVTICKVERDIDDMVLREHGREPLAPQAVVITVAIATITITITAITIAAITIAITVTVTITVSIAITFMFLALLALRIGVLAGTKESEGCER